MSSTATRALAIDLASLDAAWNDALPTLGIPDTDPQAQVESMSGIGLLTVNDVLARAERHLAAVRVRVAGEIANRSTPELGREGLAKQQGYRSATALVAAASGGSTAEAARLIAVGAATASRQAFSGHRMPPRHPHVAVEVDAGRLSVDAAAVIITMLDRVTPRADPDHLRATERTLARRAPTLTLEQLHRLVAQAETYLDTDGVGEREDALTADQSVGIRQEPSGMLRFTARLNPVNGALLKTAIETLVTARIRSNRDADPTDSAPVSIPRMQADALVAITEHASSCRETITPLDLATIIIRINHTDLVTGVGPAFIDGINQPVSAGTVRRIAGQAGIIPLVLGGPSEVLDLGRTHRLFTIPQRIALAERDGGCAFCGTDGSYAEAHHITWWDRDTGPTDLDNGVLLCRTDHQRIHHDGWTITSNNGNVWFIPPARIDPTRTPRLGGRARHDYTPEQDDGP
ncbi:DUF222 domain-containing protein [Leifsonia sp. YIM 134122]|uniref:DUF222 domain-containing protein n=1 Tax=Leifsonia stereocauli TaxID=3134136 RepID=A0ABU9W6F1_9MICO